MQENIFFTGTNRENRPITLMINCENTRTPHEVTLEPSYPLHYIIYYFNKFIDDPEFFTNSSAAIDHITHIETSLDKSFLQLKKNNKKIIIKTANDADKFSAFFLTINELMQCIAVRKNHKFNNKEKVLDWMENIQPLFELLLSFSQKCRSLLEVKTKKSKVNDTIDDFIINQMSGVTLKHIQYGNFQSAEIYLKIQRKLIDEITKTDEIRVREHKLGNRLALAEVYFSFGYAQAALNLIREIHQISKRSYCPQFEPQIDRIVTFFKKMVGFYKNKNNLITLQTSQMGLSLLELFHEKRLFNKTYKIDAPIAEGKKDITTIFSQAKVDYTAELRLIMQSDKGIKSLIKKIAHDFNNHYLLITLKSDEAIYLHCTKSIFQSYGVKSEIKKNQEGQFQLKIDLYDLKPSLLGKICEDSLGYIEAKLKRIELEKQTIEKRKIEEKLNQEILLTHSLPNFPSPPPTTDDEKSFATIKSQKKTPKRKDTDSTSFEIPEKTKTFTYHWLNTGLTYRSEDKNNGVVKMLTHDAIPDGLWFGYIPEEMMHDENYHTGFTDRLLRGKLQKDCIRNITKEIQTKNLQNTDSKYLYKFKIVIPSFDFRLYGWIDDFFTDETDEKHFLIYFGMLADHKIKHLPDPEKIKKQHLIKQSEKRQKEYLLEKRNIADTFIGELIEIIYEPTLVIPENMKESLLSFTNSFYECFEIFDKLELVSEKIDELFSVLRKMNAQLVELGQSEVGSEEQLIVLKAIICNLSSLKDQSIYQKAMGSLLKKMTSFESNYWINDENPQAISAFTKTEKSKADIEADTLIDQLDDALQEAKKTVDQLVKESDAKKNSTDNSDYIQKKSSIQDELKSNNKL